MTATATTASPSTPRTRPLAARVAIAAALAVAGNLVLSQVLAAAGREPFHSLVPQLVEAWITWAAEVLDGTPGSAVPKPRPPSPSWTASSSCASSPAPTQPTAPADDWESARSVGLLSTERIYAAREDQA